MQEYLITYNIIIQALHYAIFQKKSNFSYTLKVYVYNTCNLILVPFCFYKSYHNIIRQHLYINIKCIQIKKTTTYFKYIPMKTQLQCTLHHKVYISLHLPLL